MMVSSTRIAVVLAFVAGCTSGESNGAPTADAALVDGPDAEVSLDVLLNFEEEAICFGGELYQVKSIEMQLVDETMGQSCVRERVCVEIPGVVNLVESADEIAAFLRAEDAPLLSAPEGDVTRIEVTVLEEPSCPTDPAQLCATADLPTEPGTLDLLLRCEGNCQRVTTPCADERQRAAPLGPAQSIRIRDPKQHEP